MRDAKAPRGVQFLACVYLAVALALPLQLIWIYRLNWDNSYFGFTHMSLGNWLVFGAALTLAYHLFIFSHRSLYLLPVTFALTALNNWWVSHVDTTYSSGETLLASGLLLFSHTALLLPRSFASLKKETPKPWQQAPRHLLQFTTTILPPLGPALMLQSHDVSLSGMFLCDQKIQTPRGEQPVDNLDHIHEGSEVNLKVQIDQLRTLRFRAVVVRKLRAREQDYPSGLGLKFQGIDRETKKQLRSQLP